MYDACTIGNSLFFISGDISTNVLHFMYGVYYNMDLLKNLNLEDPVKYVDDMTWTIDKMIEMSSGLYQDLDQSGKQSDLDFYTNEERGDAVRMFDIIHDTIDFDLGRIFAYALSGMSEMPSKAAAKGTSWGATMKAQDKTLRTDLASKVVGPLRALNP